MAISVTSSRVTLDAVRATPSGGRDRFQRPGVTVTASVAKLLMARVTVARPRSIGTAQGKALHRTGIRHGHMPGRAPDHGTPTQPIHAAARVRASRRRGHHR